MGLFQRILGVTNLLAAFKATAKDDLKRHLRDEINLM